MSDKFILVDKVPVPCDDLLEWGCWMQTADRRVAKTQIGPLRVSTVFLGLDHRHFEDGSPLVFETMIFGEDQEHDSRESYCDRCSTWEEAEAMHQRAIVIARERLASAEHLLQGEKGK